MSKGRVYQDPQFRYIDSHSGREIVQLTNYLGHSNHLYFTDPCWIGEGRAFVFTSDRENQSNLFRYDLETGQITQMTDFKGPGRPGGCVSAVNEAVYTWWQNRLYEINVETLAERIVCTAEPPMLPRGRANPTADGKYICTMLMEDQPQEGPRIAFAYSRFREFFAKKPFTQITRIDLETGKQDIIHEDKRYMGHVNTSPTQANILSYCHEGPWAQIEQRIWGLDINSGETWKIRPQDEAIAGQSAISGQSLAIGHEYWFADGERIG